MMQFEIGDTIYSELLDMSGEVVKSHKGKGVYNAKAVDAYTVDVDGIYKVFLDFDDNLKLV